MLTDPNCIFCKIIAGTIPAEKYYEDEGFLAIFDIQPIAPKHLLVFSKNHYIDIATMPLEEWLLLNTKARELAEKLKSELRADGYNYMIYNGEAAESAVPHRPHIHIIPRYFNDGLHLDPRTTN
jgi:histidine triad (HIT) family protein